MTLRHNLAALGALILLTVAIDSHSQSQTGVIKVTSKPLGAKVYIAGKIFGKTPILVEIAAGRHTLTVSRDGYAPVTRPVMVSTNKMIHTHISLGPAPRKDEIRVHNTGPDGEDSGPGTVTVTTQPSGLTVFMNDMFVPQPTPVAFDLRAGVYQIRIEEDGAPVYNKSVFVRAGRTVDLDIIIKRRRRIDDSDPWQ
jgi:PEGA domain-containing protein